MISFTQDQYITIAQRYSSKTQLRIKNWQVFKIIRDNGWLEYCKFSKPHRKITKNLCKELASQCQTKAEFRKLDLTAYTKALHHNWLSEFNLADKPIKWNKEACIQAANNCLNRNEFRKRYPGAYNSAFRNKWIDAIQFPIKPRCNKRTNEEIIEVAKKYTTLSDFYKYDRNFYNLAHHHKLIKSFTWLKRKEDRLDHSISDTVYVYEFPNKVVYIGRTINTTRRHYEHTHDTDSPVYKYAKNNQLDVPTPIYVYANITYKEGQIREAELIEQYKANHWTLLNKMPAGGLGSLRNFCKSTCINIAAKYHYKKDLYQERPDIYAALHRHGWMSECTWLMSYKPKYADITYEQFIEITKSCKTRSDVFLLSHSLYSTAKTYGWLDNRFPAKIIPCKIEQYALDGTFIASYNTIGDAARALNIPTDTIIRICKGYVKKPRTYIFKYKTDNISYKK